MAFSLTKILKGILIREENTLTPKEIEITPGGTASTKTTIVSSQTTNKTLTLPDATDTLVGKSTTDILTNKIIDVANNTITTAPNGNLVATELNSALAELQSDIDTRATSTALTIHTGSSSGVHGVTGSVVGTTDTQTLTNKTLNSPALTGIPTAPTAISGTNTTQVATTAFVTSAVAGAGANTQLSNLISPVEINQHLAPISPNNIDVGNGTTGLNFRTVYASEFGRYNGGQSRLAFNGSFQGIYDADGASLFNWSGTGNPAVYLTRTNSLGAREFRFQAPNGPSIGFKAPTSISSDFTLALPNTAGSAGNVLQTDGSSNLTWKDLTPVVLSASSSTKTPTASAVYHQLTGNSVNLIAGNYYELSAIFNLTQSGSAGYSLVAGGLFLSNGADTSTVPTLLNAGGLSVLSNYQSDQGLSFVLNYPSFGAINGSIGSTGPIIVLANSNITVYAVTYSSQSTTANARVSASIVARKL